MVTPKPEEPKPEPSTPVAKSFVQPSSNEKKETPSLFRRKEVVEEKTEDLSAKLNEDFTQEQIEMHWKEYGTARLSGGAGDAEKLVLSRTLTKQEGALIQIGLGSQLEMSILEKFEADVIQYLRKNLRNDSIQLTKTVKEVKESQKLYTSKDKYEFMVQQNPALKSLKEKLGLDFEY